MSAHRHAVFGSQWSCESTIGQRVIRTRKGLCWAGLGLAQSAVGCLFHKEGCAALGEPAVSQV